jgi:hypothetical protein
MKPNYLLDVFPLQRCGSEPLSIDLFFVPFKRQSVIRPAKILGEM